MPLVGTGLTADDVRDLCEQRLARFKCPTTITILKYQITGNTMRLVFDVTGTIGATPAAVSIPIPDGYRTPESCSAGMYAYSDAGTPGTGDAIAVGDRIDLYKNINATAWTAGTARAQGTIAFEVQ